MEKKDNLKLLKSIYTDIQSPGAYAGINALYREAKKQSKNITYNEVIHFLEGQRTYGLFKPRRLRYPKSATVPSGYMTDLQADLAGKLPQLFSLVFFRFPKHCFKE
jgi:hypothetical protein